MKVIDLTDAHKGLFAACLEDWSDEIREAGDRRACWVERFLARGLRAKLDPRTPPAVIASVA